MVTEHSEPWYYMVTEHSKPWYYMVTEHSKLWYYMVTEYSKLWYCMVTEHTGRLLKGMTWSQQKSISCQAIVAIYILRSS
ncbi:hypothetical protein EB796_003768 [Bugula neritina]|uniref:Uncharacterized protein n=1 Tax=Bugula neritina TaxID=10212 RepID=A0A7J7KH69_BUGNE|nr:hypothetical protein EB796_003768 [Bugula neritina]